MKITNNRSPDSKYLVADAEDRARHKLFAVSIADGSVSEIVSDHHNANALFAGNKLVYLQDSLTVPADVFLYDFDRKTSTQVNLKH